MAFCDGRLPPRSRSGNGQSGGNLTVNWVVVIRKNAARLKNSSGGRLETIIVVQTAEHRFGNDTVTLANPMAIRTDADTSIGRFGDARPKTRVPPPPIVIRHPLGEHVSQMPLAQRNHKVETLAANRANQAFAERVRLGRPHGRLDNGEAHRLQRAIDTLGVDAVVVVDDKSV